MKSLKCNAHNLDYIIRSSHSQTHQLQTPYPQTHLCARSKMPGNHPPYGNNPEDGHYIDHDTTCSTK
jgi:hypothetical protein